jgi:RNA polymerase sigma-70 factor, ECF subfamily
MSDHQETLSAIRAEIPALRRFARFMTRDADYGDGLVQECLTRAIANIDSWQPGTNGRAWLFVLLRDVFRNDRHRAASTLACRSNLELELLLPRRPNPLALPDVQTAYLQLKENYREVLLLVAIEGLRYDEAASVLNISVSAVRSRLSRARAALRTLASNGSRPIRLQPAMNPVRKAHARGMRLLEENLTPAQHAQLKKHGHFDVIGGETRTRYRIKLGSQVNVKVLDGKGRAVRTLCFMPRGDLVIGDIMLAQKLALELFESGALKVANKFPPHPWPRRPAL